MQNCDFKGRTARRQWEKGFEAVTQVFALVYDFRSRIEAMFTHKVTAGLNRGRRYHHSFHDDVKIAKQ